MRNARNRAAKGAIHTLTLKLWAVVDANDKAQAVKTCRDLFSSLDKSVKRGIITRNTADRRKSRAAKRVAKIK